MTSTAAAFLGDTPTSYAEVTPAGLPALTVAYERHGAGSPLVLLHGIGHHRQAWHPVMAELAARHEVFAVDLPGFGASPAQPDAVPYTMDGAVTVLGALFDALGVEQPFVAGNSLGGLIALHLARAGRARGIAALSPGGFWNDAEWWYASAVLSAMRRGAQLVPPAAVERLARSGAGRAALVGSVYARPGRRAPEAVVAETRALREATGFEATLAAARGQRPFTGAVPPRVPVTVAWGTRDRLLPRRQGVRLKRMVPHARLVRLPGCGHVPMNDDPQLVARVILDAAR
ncbi:alpha/beta fold hydrolase [Streptomyces sp. ICBB 8177]|uniref:alpha/beta fold hydrolase n=1 Tax=Streptomyces sp. ICBB 8177 TaxID=563922 RepID=UPI000D6736B3|nr:alpha/beta fold hydrolase [Streptomyces sp. ICBB 8177]PWI42690.1 alpha/beta hydrolase [Streptomyces sp. ICBB 8177]